ncbi:MAG: AAA family ATPase [Candidatus Promineifilaceae bacterium]
MSSEKIDALKQALGFAPDNHVLRQMLAEALREVGDTYSALQAYGKLMEAEAISAETLISVGNFAADNNQLPLASACLDAAIKNGLIEGTAALRHKIDKGMEDQGFVRMLMPVSAENDPIDPEHSLEPEPEITFTDVGGLADVKKTIHKMIILPFLRPEIYRKYGRKSGGGVMMYGPPGCGKTMLARATAGECKLPFVNIRIEDVLDPYIGVSERNLHNLFEHARSQAPVVIFLDELDGLAYARKKRSHSVGRTLVDQLLQELDSIGSDNRALLALGATNAPWDIDDALLRPGRYDRRLFVPPPDEEARLAILNRITAEIPNQGLNLKTWAKKTPLFSGADIRALVDAAVDQVIEQALETGDEPPLQNRHFEVAIKEIIPTTIDWLKRAQNYVEFANEGKRYDEVAQYLKQREVKRNLR